MLEHHIMITALFLYSGATFAYFTRFVRAGNILISLGILLNLTGLILRGYVGDSWFFALAVDELLSLPLFLALTALVSFHRGEDIPGRVITIPLVLFSFAAFLPVPVQVLPSVKVQSLVAPVFFITETISVALFIAGGFTALAALLFHGETQTATRQCILWGFVIFTVCQIIGAVWAFVGWSYPFSWTTRHLASACTWCLYAALLHAGYARISQRTHALCAAMALVPISFIVFYHELSRGLLSLAGAIS